MLLTPLDGLPAFCGSIIRVEKAERFLSAQSGAGQVLAWPLVPCPHYFPRTSRHIHFFPLWLILLCRFVGASELTDDVLGDASYFGRQPIDVRIVP